MAKRNANETKKRRYFFYILRTQREKTMKHRKQSEKQKGNKQLERGSQTKGYN